MLNLCNEIENKLAKHQKMTPSKKDKIFYIKQVYNTILLFLFGLGDINSLEYGDIETALNFSPKNRLIKKLQNI